MTDRMNVTVIGLDELTEYFRTFPEKSDKIVEDVIKEKALKLERQYKLNLRPSGKTGDLENSVFSKIKKTSAIVGSTSLVSLFIEFGTKRHEIKVKNKKVLSDKVDFFGKNVMHPGTRAKYPMTRAFGKHIGIFGQWLIEALKQEFKKI